MDTIGSIIIPMDKLLQALDTLDLLLGKHQLRINILICGAFALEMYGLKPDRGTFDVDSAIPLRDDIYEMIDEVAASLGLERSSGDRRDFISMKISAFFIRRGETTKDLEDLRLLNPSNDEIDEALGFVANFNSPPAGSPKSIIEDYKESVDDIKRLFKK